MSDEIETGAKKDEGVKVTLSLNNEMLAQMISKGIQDLPKEVIHTLSYEAVRNALQDKEFMKHLLFYSEYRGYDWWEHSQPQTWFAEMLSRSFTDKEEFDALENDTRKKQCPKYPAIYCVSDGCEGCTFNDLYDKVHGEAEEKPMTVDEVRDPEEENSNE